MRRAIAALAVGVALMVAACVSEQAQRAPSIPNLAGKILTVRGPIDPSAAGQTLMHEHIFIDFKPPPPMVPPVTGLSVLRPRQADPPPAPDATPGSPRARRGNGGLTIYDESLAEIMEFKKIGGGTIVDVTNFGLTRDPETLLRVSKESGLNVVMGAGWYQKGLHPPDMTERTVEELTAIVVHDVTVGAQGTKIRSGIIGEVGVNARPMIDNEIKSIRASARAARLTGAPMTIHSFGTPEEMLQTLDIIASEGVDMSHVVMGHSGGRGMAYMKQLFERGVYVEWDYMGQSPLSQERADKIVQGIADVINAGYADKVIVAHDICTQEQLEKNGGGGYTYISTVILPGLKAKGISDENIRKILVDNPRRALTFVAPRPQVT